MKILARALILAGLLGCLMTAAYPAASAEPTHKTVLVLSPFQVDLSTNLIASQAIREEFGKADDLNLNVYYEYLDFNRFPDPAYQQNIFDLLSVKYEHKQIDLVIVGSEAMLKLWLAQHSKILPDTPIVFFDVFTEHLDALDIPANVTGASGVEDCEKSVQWSLEAMPKVNEVVLVMGAGKIEQGFSDHIQKLQENMNGQVKFTNQSGLPIAEITQRVAKLPKTAIVLYHPMFEDSEGNKYHPLEVLQELTTVSSVPIIGGYDQFIGTGIIGGYMYSIDQQARDAAHISLRILRGESPSTIPVSQDKSNLFIFDHLALQRYDFPLSLLPSDSIIKNRQYSFVELYRTQIILASVSFTLLTLFVIFLGITTQRLSKARSELKHLNDNLEFQVQERTAALSQINHDLEQEVAERQQAEAALQESEARFRSYFELPLTGRAITSPEKGWIDVNATLCEMLGYTKPELVQLTWAELTHPDDIAADLVQFNRVLAGEIEGYDLEKRFLCKDGHVIHTRLAIQCLRKPDRSVDYIVALILDVTEHKQAEEKLHESEEKFRSLLDSQESNIMVYDFNGVHHYVNQGALATMANGTSQDIIGKCLHDLYPEHIADWQLEQIRQVFSTGKGFSGDFRIASKNQASWWHLNLQPIHDPSGRVMQVMVNSLDITERKHAEEQLRETHDTLQTIIYSSPLTILTFDSDDCITMWNPAAESMFGWSEKQTLGQVDPTIPENKLREAEALRDATLSGMSFSNVDTVRMKNNGEQFPVSLSVAPLRGQQNEVIGRLHIITDITERKKLQEELRQQATTDELTKVSNRRHFIELANSEIKRAVRLKRPPAFALIDIDHFKQINDTYGHAIGDLALIEFTKVCQKQIREIDVLARFGGDEFVLLFPETNKQQAYEIVERIRLALMKTPADLHGEQVAITLSCGIASLGDEQISLDTLLNRADQALYRAKETGRNRVVIDRQ